MEAASTFVLASSAQSAARIRDMLTRHGALLWASGNLLASRAAPDQVGRMLDEAHEGANVELVGREIPADVMRRLPPAVRMLVDAQQLAPQKEAARVGESLSWDAPGHEAPRFLRKQGVDSDE